MAEPVWVAELHISRRIAEKLVHKHGVQAEEIRHALIGAPGLRGWWFDEGGRRAIVRVTIRRRLHVVVLYPVPHRMGGVWRLGSAYPERRWR